MSKRFKGALLSATPPTTTGGTTGSGSAPGMWTLQQEMQAKGSNAWPETTNYIEDVFSTYLYAGNGTSQTITNNIDLATKGGLVWIKNRVTGTTNHVLTDTVRGANASLASNSTAAQSPAGDEITGFTSSGFSVGGGNVVNESAKQIASWTFRKQPKFFDVVTWTGTGSARTVAHNLGSVPGCIMVKCTSTDGGWIVYHRSTTATSYLLLNSTNSVGTRAVDWNNTEPTSTEFTVGTGSTVNGSGATFVAYIFAHNAGGFGLTGTDNVISCGSFAISSGVDSIVNLGYEPQWLLIKKSTGAGSDWRIIDNMRGMAVSTSGSDDANLYPNTSGAEALGNVLYPTATGFVVPTTSTIFDVGDTYIYIAIRRGPMKVPTDGTKVFGLNARTGTGAVATVTGGLTSDAVLIKNRGAAVASLFSSRLTNTGYLVTSTTAAEVAAGATILQANPWDVMDGVKVGTTSTITNASANTFINYLFKRAPSFFDEVCYTGTGSAQTLTHNLGATPELIIVKRRNGLASWYVYSAALGATKFLQLNTTDAQQTSSNYWNDTAPTSTVFTVGTTIAGNTDTFVAYLFATCAGVSKVGSYTGTGTTKQVDCGFAAGARFVLIKRTDSTGDWYVWDTARGIVSGNDSYLLLNTSAAQVTSTDYIDTYSAGFELSSTAPIALNASGGAYIFLAIA